MTSPERTRGAGFSDWQKKLRDAGEYKAAAFVETMGPGNTPEGDNAHTAIAKQLELLDLPVQSYLTVSVRDFHADPTEHLVSIPDGEHYLPGSYEVI